MNYYQRERIRSQVKLLKQATSALVTLDGDYYGDPLKQKTAEAVSDEVRGLQGAIIKHVKDRLLTKE